MNNTEIKNEILKRLREIKDLYKDLVGDKNGFPILTLGVNLNFDNYINAVSISDGGKYLINYAEWTEDDGSKVVLDIDKLKGENDV